MLNCLPPVWHWIQVAQPAGSWKSCSAGGGEGGDFHKTKGKLFIIFHRTQQERCNWQQPISLPTCEFSPIKAWDRKANLAFSGLWLLRRWAATPCLCPAQLSLPTFTSLSLFTGDKSANMNIFIGGHCFCKQAIQTRMSRNVGTF